MSKGGNYTHWVDVVRGSTFCQAILGSGSEKLVNSDWPQAAGRMCDAVCLVLARCRGAGTSAPLQRTDRMSLRSQIFEPAREESVHLQPVLQDRLRFRKRSKHVPQMASGMTMHRFRNMGIGIHPQLR